MTNNITVKTAVKSDADLIESLAKEIWTQHYLSIIGLEQINYMLNKFQSKSAICNDIDCGYTYLIAYCDGVPCGYSAVKQDNGVFLSKFYVMQTHRGKGVGKAMLDAVSIYAKQHNTPRIWLTCNKHNKDSLKVYRKLGFDIIDSLVTDIGSGFVMDDYVLEKRLECVAITDF